MNDQSTGLRDYVAFLRRRGLIIIVVAVLCVGICLAYCALTTPKYTASATVLLTPTLSPTLIEANGAYNTQLVDVPSDIQVIESAAVARVAARHIQNLPPVKATQVGTTDVVNVSVESTHPAAAAAAATAYAKAYISFEQAQTLNTLTGATSLLERHIATLHIATVDVQNQIAAAGSSPSVATLEAQLAGYNAEATALENQLANYQFYSSNGAVTSGQVISAASIPTKASSPKVISWSIIALVIGLVLGLGLALLVENLAPVSPRRKVTGSTAVSGAADDDLEWRLSERRPKETARG